MLVAAAGTSRAAGPRPVTSRRCPAGRAPRQARLEPYGHTFDVGTDSLRAALDATVLSPAGQAVGVDDDGRVVGVTSYDRLRVAIHAADQGRRPAAGQRDATGRAPRRRPPAAPAAPEAGLLDPHGRSAVPRLTWENAYLGIVPALIGLVISVPLGIACARWRWLYPPVLSATSVLYALPSLALFIVLIPYTGLTDTTVIIPLTLFSLCVLVPNVVDGLRSVPDPVRQAATAMGFGTLRRLVQVELPVAVPIVIAGLRVAMVSSISLASVGQLIGVSSLGYLIIDGYQRDFPTEIYRRAGAHHRARAASATCCWCSLRRAADPLAAAARRARSADLAVRAPAQHAGGGRRMSFLSFAWNWLKQPQQWHGSGRHPGPDPRAAGLHRAGAAHRGADRASRWAS